MKKILIIIAMVVFVYAKQETIVFGAGCFWGVEKYFENTKGVISAKSGYTGGNYENPTYKQVLNYRRPPKGIINHTESVEVIFDNEKISALTLIKKFWELHDPTQGNRQGNDIGNNYRSILFYTNPTQKNIALKTRDIYQDLLLEKDYGQITTQIAPLDKFYYAEEYHQNYLAKNPYGYCPNHKTGVTFIKDTKKISYIHPTQGKEIVVIDALFCPYCEKFEKDVTSSYTGTLPLRTVHKNRLKGFKIKTPIVGTPAILFFENGVEVYSHIGYMNQNDFYKELTKFKNK